MEFSMKSKLQTLDEIKVNEMLERIKGSVSGKIGRQPELKATPLEFKLPSLPKIEIAEDVKKDQGVMLE